VTAIAPAFSEYALLEFASITQKSRTTFTGNRLVNSSDLPPYHAEAAPRDSWVRLAVVGAHLSGQPLNSQLTGRGARLLRTTRTAVDYKLFALKGTVPEKPGLIRAPGYQGSGIEVEVWALPQSEFGSFVELVPPPLSIGTCELIDGERVKGFLCESYAAETNPEITHYGSWRNYLGRVFTAGPF
jgi:allophanate hydrolase